MISRYRVLIIDDDRLLQNSLKNVLSEKYDIQIAGSAERGIELLSKNEVDLILLDIRLPGMDGVEALKKIRQIRSDAVIIMMTAYEDIKTVINSMKSGASDYLVKPLDIEQLDIMMEKALEHLKLKRYVEDLRRHYLKEFAIDDIVAESEGIRTAMDMALKVARSSDTTILIEGETGTGKEVIARAIHFRSDRLGKPFVSINCGAISKDLIESELFGYEKGTFTGGLNEGKKGKIESAHGGTLLLDEISEMLPSAQVNLLRFLEEKEIYKVGGTEKKKVDVRVIAATNQSLEEAIKAGKFRSDLFYRLNVAKIFLPPLRDRKLDIVPLSLMFMSRYNNKFGKRFQGLSAGAESVLVNYVWPGNIRELRNTIERVILMEDDTEIRPVHLSFLPAQKPQAALPAENGPDLTSAGLSLDELNKKLIEQALEITHGNRTKAAKLLGISRPTMIYRIEKYEIKVNGSE